MRKASLILTLGLFPLLVSAQVHKVWVKTWGGTDDYGLGRGLALDGSGNVYVTGSTTIHGYFGCVLVKYAADGRLLWESISDGTPVGIVADDSGNVYVTGTTWSGSTPVMTTLKRLPNGDFGWSQTYGSAGASDIALDRNGNVYVCGWTKAGSPDVYSLLVVKYSSRGERLWTLADPVETYIENVVLAVDDRGVYVCVPVRGVTYVASYSLDGTRQWFKRHGKFGAYSPGYYGDIALDKQGNVYFTSSKTRDTLAQVDLLVGAYTSNGGLLWENTWICTADGMSAGGAMAVDDSTGSIFVTGLYYPDRTINVKRAVTMKYTTQGSQSWIRTYEGAGEWDRFYGIAADSRGNAYVAGFTDIGPAVAGSKNILIKYGPGGEVKWSETHMITGGDDVWVQVAVDRFENVYVGGSITTTWSPYTILLTTAKYSQKGRFKPDRDGWQFANVEQIMWPQTWWSQFDYSKPPYPPVLTQPPYNGASADFPDWPLFVDVFGIEQCYKKGEKGLHYYSPKALLYWRSSVEGYKTRDAEGNVTKYWSGSCAGFAISALRYYNDLLSLKWTLGEFENVHSVPIDDNSRYLVNKNQILPHGKQHYFTAVSASKALLDLKEMLIENFKNDRSVVTFNPKTGDVHEVVACSLAAVGSGFWELAIYDPDHPGSYMHLNYSELTEEWTGEKPGWDSLGVYLRNPIEEYGSTPILPAAPWTEPFPCTASDAFCSVFNSPYADIRIMNATGEAIGCVNGVLIDSVPGAYPQYNLGGLQSLPYGYSLPQGDYSAQIGQSLDSATYFAMFLNSAAFSFHRQGARRDDNEILHFSTANRSLSVKNPDPLAKTLFLQSIENLSGEETVCRLHVRAMPPADSLVIQLAGGRNVALVVGSSGVTTDLRLELAKDFANPVFEYAALLLEKGASYLVAPIWDSLATTPLRVYVDRDGDGTVDDTLRLENQAVSVPPGRGDQIPDDFTLQQNYPNPFNPTTTIKYELPRVAHVALRVYSTLGQEVATLVDAVQEPGYKSVEWNAAGVASGVYFCQLKAGDFVQTRKVLLLK